VRTALCSEVIAKVGGRRQKKCDLQLAGAEHVLNVIEVSLLEVIRLGDRVSGRLERFSGFVHRREDTVLAKDSTRQSRLGPLPDENWLTISADVLNAFDSRDPLFVDTDQDVHV